MKKTIDAKAMTVTFEFAHDTLALGVQTPENTLAPVVFRTDDASEANKDYAMLHGFGARIGDHAAISKSAENNFTVTETMRRAAVVEMAEFYSNTANGEWNMKATARTAPQNTTILALATKRGCTYAEAEAYIAEKLLAELGE